MNQHFIEFNPKKNTLWLWSGQRCFSLCENKPAFEAECPVQESGIHDGRIFLEVTDEHIAWNLQNWLEHGPMEADPNTIAQRIGADCAQRFEFFAHQMQLA